MQDPEQQYCHRESLHGMGLLGQHTQTTLILPTTLASRHIPQVHADYKHKAWQACALEEDPQDRKPRAQHGMFGSAAL